MAEFKGIRISMQYFAEGDEGNNQNSNTPSGSEGDNSGEGNSTSGNQNQQNSGGNPGNNNSSNTFTQADLNRIGAQEKANGKKAILKELGFTDEASAKDAMKQFKAWQDSQKTEEQKTAEKIQNATNAQNLAEQRADKAEKKLEIIKAKGNPDCIDDIMVLVSARINDTTDFNAALKAVQTAYPNFFDQSSGNNPDNGTGGGLNHQRQQSGNSGGIGARLAQNRAKSTSKNPYFNN